jgi:hypothetical protein
LTTAPPSSPPTAPKSKRCAHKRLGCISFQLEVPRKKGRGGGCTSPTPPFFSGGSTHLKHTQKISPVPRVGHRPFKSHAPFFRSTQKVLLTPFPHWHKPEKIVRCPGKQTPDYTGTWPGAVACP